MFTRKQFNKRPKDKLKTMKKFIMGENVVKDIFSSGIEPITGFIIVNSTDLSKLSVDQLNELRLIKDETERAKRHREIMCEITKNGVTWFEDKTYDTDLTNYQPSRKRFPDPEIEGVSYDNPANVPECGLNVISDTSEVSEPSDKIKNEAANEPLMSSQALEARELKSRSKQYLTDKLKQFAEQEKLDLEERKQFILWKRMNSSL